MTFSFLYVSLLIGLLSFLLYVKPRRSWVADSTPFLIIYSLCCTSIFLPCFFFLPHFLPLIACIMLHRLWYVSLPLNIFSILMETLGGSVDYPGASFKSIDHDNFKSTLERSLLAWEFLMGFVSNYMQQRESVGFSYPPMEHEVSMSHEL